MRVFEDRNGSLEELGQQDFKKERELHRTVDSNLELIFQGLVLVKSKFKIGNKEIDTLAYDRTNDTFVIIEYKKAKGMEMADQVSVYNGMVKKHQADCVLALRDNLGLQVKIEDVKWNNTRMIFVKPDFSKQEIEVLNTEKMLDLCAVRKYPRGIVVHHLGAERKRRSSQKSSNRSGAPISKAVLDKLIDGKEHKLQEIYDYVIKTLETSGIEFRPNKAKEAVRARLYHLKNAGRIRQVRRSTYQRT